MKKELDSRLRGGRLYRKNDVNIKNRDIAAFTLRC